MKRNISLTILMQLIMVSNNLFSQDPVTCEPSFVEADWNCLGPLEEDNNNNMGRIVAVWVSDFDSDYILVGTRSSGIWRSYNGGETWSNLTNYLHVA